MKNEVLDNLDKLGSCARDDFKNVTDSKKLDELRTKYLGRKSALTDILKKVKEVKQEDRAEVGKRANEVKAGIESLVETATKTIENQKLEKNLKEDWKDVTAPGVRPQRGSLHPITQLMQKTEDIFVNMGFEVEMPYEIDDDYHNFESVNIPKGHPARDAWDTFWTEDKNVLITHTSSMQNRVMKNKKPPIRIIVPGKCFRNEATDARHEHTFYQVEGIYVDKGITMTDMLGTLKTYFEAFFEKDIDVKFIPDYFPFVEPGGQIALTCVLCDGKGCKVCKGSGWLEILGCGMIHPKVLEMAGIDSTSYTGFAWGFGLERLIMLKHNINDIRLFHKGDLRFIKQFN
ncbi:phenylalanine--tRNA ligase subunit alpha [Candidatus Dojkabacteria bacterium]|nr:phenylalanine--tRNA ligase subunit alpha [Candidatus Dojkabacteria bacterium]